ncbi:MAG: secondary thiamine-phosphate synthase enzyme [Deltaproteobacteria bacterium]|jgi:secondary thiamine-phosphate synthase enzyme|nr:secondary thiamine-phosphate synthase enzyme [Deltaproteobacteria bacterium]
MNIQEFPVRTRNRTEFLDITAQVGKIIQESKVQSGLAVVYVPHTTAAVTINENADPSVQHDILADLNRLVPFSGPYQHTEGNSAAHIKSSLVGPSETLLIENGRLALGTWQGVYFCEFDGPRTRKVWVKIIPG